MNAILVYLGFYYLISFLLFLTFCQVSKGNSNEEIDKPGSTLAKSLPKRSMDSLLNQYHSTLLRQLKRDSPLLNQYHSTLLRQLKRDSPLLNHYRSNVLRQLKRSSPVFDSSALRQLKRHFSSSMFPSPSLRRLHKDMTRTWRILKKEDF